MGKVDVCGQIALSNSFYDIVLVCFTGVSHCGIRTIWMQKAALWTSLERVDGYEDCFIQLCLHVLWLSPKGLKGARWQTGDVQNCSKVILLFNPSPYNCLGKSSTPDDFIWELHSQSPNQDHETATPAESGSIMISASGWPFRVMETAAWKCVFPRSALKLYFSWATYKARMDKNIPGRQA